MRDVGGPSGEMVVRGSDPRKGHIWKGAIVGIPWLVSGWIGFAKGGVKGLAVWVGVSMVLLYAVFALADWEALEEEMGEGE